MTDVHRPEQLGPYMTCELQQRLPNRATDQWVVRDRHGGILGTIRWYGRWRQYTFMPESACVFNEECLCHLVAKLREANREHRAGRTMQREARHA